MHSAHPSACPLEEGATRVLYLAVARSKLWPTPVELEGRGERKRKKRAKDRKDGGGWLIAASTLVGPR